MRSLRVLPLALALLSTPCVAGAQDTMAVFDVELLDSSGEGESPAQTARLAMLSDVLHERLAASGRYRLVDLGPVAEEIDRQRPLYRCGGCQLALTRQVGADLALNVIVRKVSTLKQEIALIVADVRSDEIVAFHSVSIRNNSDRAWREGLLYILDNRLLRDDAP